MLHPVAVHYKGSGFYSTDYGQRRSQAEGLRLGRLGLERLVLARPDGGSSSSDGSSSPYNAETTKKVEESGGGSSGSSSD